MRFSQAVAAAIALSTVLAFSPAQGQQLVVKNGGQWQAVESGVEGLSRSDVTDIQRRLNQEGFNAGQVDGLWGSRTQRALSNFQAAKGIEPHGRLDEDTALALGFSAAEFARFETAELDKDDVRQVQEALNQAGHNPGPVDGVMGEMTKRALKGFQEARGLEPTGELNQDTVLALGLSVSEFAAGEFAEEDPADPGVR